MHHARKKSSNGSANPSMTDVRKAVGGMEHMTKHRSPRPGLSRRTTPSTAHKLGRNPRDREKQWEEERWWEEEKESFPQFCMTCEKQFMPENGRYLYCSEVCRRQDQQISPSPVISPSAIARPQNFPVCSIDDPEPRDIIPRASPSRPSSTLNFSPPTSPESKPMDDPPQYQSALSALRSLNIRPPSPPSPLRAPNHTGMWPFTRSAAVSPSTSVTKTPATAVTTMLSATYDGGHHGSANYALSSQKWTPSESDRPLPTRKPGTRSRPRSIELVTPLLGQ